MIRKMTPEDMKEWDARVEEYRTSPSIKDQICAIIMDLKIGGTGLFEDTALEKARAIVAHLELD